MKPVMVKAETLRCGDIIATDSDGGRRPYSCATVKKVDKEKRLVHMFRPYVATSDFTYTGGIICTIGMEDFVIRSEDTVLLLEKKRMEEYDDDKKANQLMKRQSELAEEYYKYKESERPVSLLAELVKVQDEILTMRK